ncbi:MAG: hypothetical protein NVSMB54_24690 [Ktedonobacteraceae bacterium]
MADYASFRQRLDAVLCTLDVKQVQEFLIVEKQWSEGQPADPEFAMWMMVAGTPSLRNFHDRAYEWLMTHGHEADAVAFLARDKKLGTKDGANRGKGGGPSGMPKFSGKKSQKKHTASDR